MWREPPRPSGSRPPGPPGQCLRASARCWLRGGCLPHPGKCSSTGGRTMDVNEVIDRARDAFNVRRVFGEPIQQGAVTLVPAAWVSGGGGGGGGEAPATPGAQGAESTGK